MDSENWWSFFFFFDKSSIWAEDQLFHVFLTNLRTRIFSVFLVRFKELKSCLQVSFVWRMLEISRWTLQNTKSNERCEKSMDQEISLKFRKRIKQGGKNSGTGWHTLWLRVKVHGTTARWNGNAQLGWINLTYKYKDLKLHAWFLRDILPANVEDQRTRERSGVGNPNFPMETTLEGVQEF